jgi:tetratricopeptide (TPR) repeat protein
MLQDDVPPGVRQLLAVQTERLDDAERAALEAASVAGRAFSAALVAAALEADVVVIDGCLAALAHSGMMVCTDGTSTWPDGTVAGAYRFNHFLYQSVIRDRVPPARRRQLHERIALRLERAYAGHTADVSGELALHFEAAGQAERAVPYLEEAGGRAVRRGANQEAVGLLEASMPRPRQEVLLAQALVNLSLVLMEVGEKRRAVDTAHRAVDLYRDLAARQPGRHLLDLLDALQVLAVELSLDDQAGSLRAAYVALSEAARLRQSFIGERTSLRYKQRPALDLLCQWSARMPEFEAEGAEWTRRLDSI